ncbi:MAG: SDR family oxidoreductase [Coriobacteriia bacterium]|nr:SDR family oxidoreductase [Coriobacteriia bacterium]
MATILITGVSTGIGKACAARFAQAGWTVVGTVRDPSRYPDGLEGCSYVEALDLEREGSASALAARVIEQVGCPDVVLNNAGVLQFGPLEEIAAEELKMLYQVNVFGQLELIRALLPAMRQRRSGTIANVTSLGGRIVFPFFAGYNSTKWALEGASEGLWHELKPFGIRVKVIEPGFVQTAIWGKVLPDSDEGLPGSQAYRPSVKSMRAFESSITDRTTPEAAADEVFRAVTDDSDRLRYPVAAYARPILAGRRFFGDRAFMRFFHRRWMGGAQKT